MIIRDEYGRPVRVELYPDCGALRAREAEKEKEEELRQKERVKYESLLLETTEYRTINIALNNIIAITQIAIDARNMENQGNVIGFLDDLIRATYSYSRTRFEEEEEDYEAAE